MLGLWRVPPGDREERVAMFGAAAAEAGADAEGLF
jgi:hypothetical protein